MTAKKPHFLEVFLPNLSSQRLEVPFKFLTHFKGKTSGSLSLTGPSGKSWHVDLVEHNGHLFFEDGWPTFIEDHSLQCGDSLVFRYDGNLHFTVQIFDQSSCEKEEAFYAKCNQQSLNNNGCLGKRRAREREASLLDLLADTKCRRKLFPVDCFKEKDSEVCTDENEYANCSQEVADGSEKRIVLALPRAANTEHMASLVKSHNKKKISNGKKKAAKKKQKAGIPINSSISQFIESRAAQYLNSNFPYFVRVMNYSNISGNGTMKVPIKFSSVHFPNSKIKVTIKNLNGDSWMINSIPTARKTSTMHTFCGGWLGFVRGNGVKIEDVCIFEFVGKYEMLVRVLRLGVEGLDTQTRDNSIDVCGTGTLGWPLETVTEQTGGDHDAEKLSELCTYEDEAHTVNTETMSTTLQEEVLVDNSEGATMCMNLNHAALSPTPRIYDKFLLCNAEETVFSGKTGDKRPDLQDAHMLDNQSSEKEARAAISFTSPFPNFMKMMMSSNVGGSFTLAVPSKFSAAHLPPHRRKIVLKNLKGDSWDVVVARYGYQTKLCGGWMSFVRKNNVKVGDVCVFELVDDKVFQVRVFSSDQMGKESPNNDAVADDPIGPGESTGCIVLPQA